MSSLIGALISEPTAFVIVERTGPENVLILEGRALPYRPLPFEGKMRADFTWYPGNPVATVQVLGAEEGPTVITGMWKDRFLAAFDAFGIPVISGRTARATFNGNDVANVRDLAEIVDGFRLRGQLIEVGWDQFIRQGILMRFRQTWLRREDLEWEMEFQWINRGEPQTPVAFGVRIPVIDIVNQIRDAITNVQAVLEAPFAFVSAINNEINNALAVIEEATALLANIAQAGTDDLLSPLEVARNTLAALQTVKNQAGEIANIFESVPARAQRTSAVEVAATTLAGAAEEAAAAAGGIIAGEEVEAGTGQAGATAAPLTTSGSETAGIADLTQEQALQAESVKRNVRARARALRAIASQRAQEVEAQTIRVPNIESFIAQDGQDLRDISARFYDTPEEWKRLLIYNNLTDSKLRAGTIILIPPLSAPEGGC